MSMPLTQPLRLGDATFQDHSEVLPERVRRAVQGLDPVDVDALKARIAGLVPSAEDAVWRKACVLIATMCNTTSIPTAFADAREHVIKPPKYATTRVWDSNGIVAMRNHAVQAFLEAPEFTHLWMLDNDMLYPPESLEVLVRDDKDIVSGWACGRVLRRVPNRTEPTFLNTFWKKAKTGRFRMDITMKMPGPPGLYRCGQVSFGGVLIKRKVLANMPRPFFSDAHHEKDAKGDSNRVSEDIFFCVRAAEAGFQVWCDTRLKYGHLIESAVYPVQLDDSTPSYETRMVDMRKKR